MAARDPFQSPYVARDPIAEAKRKRQKQQRWNRVVLQRQRILKANGFNVVVDGNWGKRTSSAWWRYNRGLAPLAGTKAVPANPVGTPGEGRESKPKYVAPPPIVPKFAKQPTVPEISKNALARSRAAAAAAKVRDPKNLPHLSARALADVRRQPLSAIRGNPPSILQGGPTQTQWDTEVKRRNTIVQVKMEREAKHRFQVATKKSADPKTWDTRDIVSLFADPLTRIKDWQNKPEWVTKIQVWLTAHGHYVGITGIWNAETADAVKAEMERRQRNYNRWRANQIVKRIYTPLGLKPGDPGFPGLGITPTPQQLVELNDQGGFTAQFVFNALAQQLYDINSTAAFRSWQHQELNNWLMGGSNIAVLRSAFGVFLKPWMIEGMTTGEKYALMLLGFSSQGEQAEQQAKALAEADRLGDNDAANAYPQGFEVTNDPRQKGDTLYQQVRAIANATSEQDLQNKLRWIQKADEKDYQLWVAVKKATEDDWLSGVGGVLTRALSGPTEFVQDTMIAAESAIATIARTSGWRPDEDPQALYERYQQERELHLKTWAQFEQDHPWYSFAIDVATDPYNLVPATWVSNAWRATKSGVKAVEEAGDILISASAKGPLPVRYIGKAGGVGLKLAPAYLQGVQQGVHGTRAAIKASKVGRLGRTVKEMTDEVTTTVSTGARNLFQPSKVGDPADLAAIKDNTRDVLLGRMGKNPFGEQVEFNIIENIDAQIAGAVEGATKLANDLIATSAKNRLSLYTHMDGQVESDWGRQTRAAFMEFARVMHIDNGAAEAAKSAYEASIKKQKRLSKRTTPDLTGLNDEARARVVQAVQDEVNAMHGKAMQEAKEAADQFRTWAGTHQYGAKFEVAKKINDLTAASGRVWDTAIAPALQRQIEASLDAWEQHLIDSGRRKAGYLKRTLWASDGNYAVGNRSKTVEILRQMLRDTFNDLEGEFTTTAQVERKLSHLKKEMLSEHEAEFAARSEALDEQIEKMIEGDKSLREVLLGRRVAVIKHADGDIVARVPLEEKPVFEPSRRGPGNEKAPSGLVPKLDSEGNQVFRMETPGEAASRHFETQGLDPAKHTWEDGSTVRPFPILINKKDNSILFAHEAEAKLAKGRAGEDLSDWHLTEARVNWKGNVESLSEKVVDLESGELVYSTEGFIDSGMEGTPEFKKARNRLKYLDNQIESFLSRKSQARRGHTEAAKSSFTARDQARLNGLQEAKRLLLAENEALATWTFRGRNKKKVSAIVKGMLNDKVGDAAASMRKALQDEKTAARQQIDSDIADAREALKETKKSSHVWIENQDYNRVYTREMYEEYIAMAYGARKNSIGHWAATRRATGDMKKEEIEETVTRLLKKAEDDAKSRFTANGDGTYTFTTKGWRVPAIYARNQLGAYRTALKGRHEALTSGKIPPWQKKALSLGATPAEAANYGALAGVERLAAAVTGVAPYPVKAVFKGADTPGGAVSGAQMEIVPQTPTRRGIPDDLGTRVIRNPETGISERAQFQSRVKRDVEKVSGILKMLDTGAWEYKPLDPEAATIGKSFHNLTTLIKVGEQHAYPQISKQHYAYARALKETQSANWKLLHDVLTFTREMFVFAVLPGRPAALFRNAFDSMLKIITSGLQDPRHWYAPGMTDAEIKARQMGKAISGEARGAMFRQTRKVGGPNSGVFARRIFEEEMELRTAMGVFADAHQSLRNAKNATWDKAFEVGAGADEVAAHFFQFGVNQMDQMIRLMVGPKYADAMSMKFRHIMNTAFWARPVHDVAEMLRVEGIDIKDMEEIVFGVQTILKDGESSKLMPRSRPSNEDWARMEGVRDQDIEDWIKSHEGTAKMRNTDHPVVTLLSHFSGVTWDLMVGRMEGWIRKGLFQSEYAKVYKKTGDRAQALTAGMKKIDDTLFDYSKQTVLDENLRYLIPFYFFWRRNLAHWGVKMVQKPWIPATLLMYQEAMSVQNKQDPEWSQRYVRMPFLNDAMSKLPIANWLLGAHPDGFEVGTDPMSWVSAAPLYRAFKSENPTLPPDRAGWKFVSGLVEGMSEFGLGLSPWFRKPLELVGVIDYRAWQAMFPQTSMVDAYTERYLKELFPEGLNIEEVLQDAVFQHIGVGMSARDLNERRINESIQLEMAAQAARGEVPNREKATERVRQFIFLQTVFAFSSGAYLRNLDPTQLNLYKIQQELVEEDIDYLEDLSEAEKTAYQLFVRRKMNPGAYDAYVNTLQDQEAFYAMEGDWEQRQQFLNDHPEIIPYVTPERNGRPAFGNVDRGMRHIGLVADTKATINTLKVFDETGLDEPGVRESLETHFVTKELREFWTKNDTKADMRDSMIKGEVHRYLRDMRTDYFNIPERDREARQKYLEENPLLASSFVQDNLAADDLRAVLNSVNADLREVYFDYVEKKDWDSARDFLARFPRMFVFTKAEDRVSDDGTWLPAKAGSARAKAYVAAEAGIQHYYTLKKTNKEAAYKWLASADPAAKLARDYFAKYAEKGGTKSEHARDYVKLKPVLTWFFETLPEKGEYKGYHSKWEWVFESKDPQAIALRRYFRKYGDKDGMSQHAKDYVAIKGVLKPYFDLREAGKEEEARAYLDKHPELSAYFKKYGKTNAAARKWGAWVKSENPEINRRLMFWKRYFELEPSARPAFVHSKADEYGIFIWGRDEEKARHDHEQDYLRKAKKRHLTPKAALYLKVKPLLDLMHTLDGTEKKILLRLNPDLREYLDKFSSGPKTGNKALDRKVESYFKLPPDGPERAAFLRQNPEVQDYFDAKNPADAAIHNLLEVYFGIEDMKRRSEFADLHPEISDYFDRKREERDNLRGALQEFDLADPRDEELRERAQFEIVHAAEIMWARLRMDGARRLAGDELLVRRERDPERVKTRQSTL